MITTKHMPLRSKQPVNLNGATRSACAGIAFALLTMAGCGSTSEDGQSPRGEVPAALAALESTAEDAYDQALAGNAAQVADQAAALDEGWQAFRPTAVADGVAASEIELMDRAVAGLLSAVEASTDPVTLARAANAVSEPMDDLYAAYEPVIPTELLALDYLGREVVLDGRAGDLTQATADTDTVESTWSALRPRIVAAGGDQQAADYDASIDALRVDITAADATQLEVDANVGLELIDAMEGLY